MTDGPRFVVSRHPLPGYSQMDTNVQSFTGCCKYLGLDWSGRAVECGRGMAQCYACFTSSHPGAKIARPDERTARVEAAIHTWQTYLRGFPHAHVELDANARHLLARIAVAALFSEEAAGVSSHKGGESKCAESES